MINIFESCFGLEKQWSSVPEVKNKTKEEKTHSFMWHSGETCSNVSRFPGGVCTFNSAL